MLSFTKLHKQETKSIRLSDLSGHGTKPLRPIKLPI